MQEGKASLSSCKGQATSFKKIVNKHALGYLDGTHSKHWKPNTLHDTNGMTILHKGFLYERGHFSASLNKMLTN